MSKRNDNSETILYLNKYMKGRYIFLIISSVSLLTIAAFNILKVYFMELVVNSLEKNQLDKVLDFFLIFLLFIGLGAIASFFETYSVKKLAVSGVNRIRESLFAKVLYLNEETIQLRHSGKVVSLFTNELLQIENFLSDCLYKIIYYPIIFLAGLIYMMSINIKLTIVSIIVIPPLLAISKKMSNKLQKYSNYGYKALADSNATAQDCIQGMDTVKAFNLEDSLIMKYEKQTQKFWKWQKQTHKLNSFLLPFVILTYELPIVICCIYGGILCMRNNEVNAGGLIAFIQLLGYIIEPLADVPDLISNYMRTKAAVLRVYEVENFSCDEKKCIIAKDKRVEKSKNIVEFSNVSFGYKNNNKILKNINLKIPYNSVVGLVGASGGGKTTVLNLILGLYTNYEGLIKVMGKELREWSLDELRQNISASLREDYFFSDTIYNNIQIANPKISMEEIEKEFIAANAYDFIMKTNLQLDTLIGSGGIGLSGGEMQRLSFARALMKKSKLLILDEPTSALDKKSEEIIRRSIYDRKNEQTIVIISHRLDILKEADIIYVLEDGKIVEMGTYQKIVENKKLYKKLYKQEFYETVGKL